MTNRNGLCADEFVHCNNPISDPTLHETILELEAGCTVSVQWIQSDCLFSEGDIFTDEFHLIIENFMINDIDCPVLEDAWALLDDEELEETMRQFYKDVAFDLETYLVQMEFDDGGTFWCNGPEDLFFTDFITSSCQQILAIQGEQIYTPGSLPQGDFLYVDCGLGCCLRTTRFCDPGPPAGELVTEIVGYNNTGGCIEEAIFIPNGYKTLGECRVSVICEEY